MPQVDELKRRARRAESDGDYRKALDLYREALGAEERREDDGVPEPSLFLRIGDLHVRLDDREAAVDAYLDASTHYARQGLVTNAVAVLNKVLRIFPDEVECYRLLAELQDEMGLGAEARRNLIRYLEAAREGEGDPDRAVRAAESFLEEEPDQELCLRTARMLDRVGSTEEALSLLKRVWEKRTGRRRPAGDIEELALRLDPDVDLSAWTPEWPPVGDDVREARGARERRQTAVERADEAPAAGDRPAVEHEKLASEERERVAAALASERSGEAAGRFDEAPEVDGGAPDLAGDGPEEGRPGGGGADGDRCGKDGDLLEEGGGGGTRERCVRRYSRRSGAPDDGPEEGRSPRRLRSEGGGTRAEEAGGRPVSGGGESGAGNGGGLRRGLGVLEELLELDPADPRLRRRKVEYARRLGDPELLEEALVELGDLLADRGAVRGARLVYEEVLDHLNPESRPAMAGIDRVEAADGDGDRARPSARREPAVGPSVEPSEIDDEFRRRLSAALERAPRELARLQSAGLAATAGEVGGAVSWRAHRELGRYLLLRGHPEEACRHLEAALERAPAGSEADADILYHLGVAHRRADRPGEARDRFRRLADRDPGFAVAWAAVSP